MICKNCGSILPTDKYTCDKCGYENDNSIITNNNFFTQKNNNHNFARFLIVVICLICLFIGLFFFVSSLNKVHLKPQKTTEVLYGKSVKKFNEDNFLNTLKNTASDIDGLTQYDKYQMGLKYYDNSDSDKDGISDKEEIEIYHSDPLNPSTANDNISDGYKLNHNMDIQKKYDNADEISSIEFLKNQCPEIGLSTTANCLNVNAVVADVTGTDSIPGSKIVNEYHIYNYEGNLSIATDAIKTKYPLFYIMKNDELNNWAEVTAEKTDESYLLDCHLEYDNNYYIIVIKSLKDRVADKIDNTINNVSDGITSNNSDHVETQYCIISGFPFLAQSDLFNKPYNILYNETSKPSALAETELNNYCNDTIDLGPDHINNIEIVDEYSLKWTINFYNSALRWFRYPEDGNINLLHCFFCYDIKEETILPGQYETDDETDDEEEDEEEDEDDDVDIEEPNPRYTEFNMANDALPFRNFGTLKEPGGHCAAFSYLTASVYNTNSFSPKGSYTIYDEEVLWDLTKHSENQTLMDKILSDYKDSSFVDDHNVTVNNNTYISNLSEDEIQFVNMMDCILFKSNDSLPLIKHRKDIDPDISYELIDRIKDELNNNHICDFGFYIPGENEIISEKNTEIPTLEELEDNGSAGHAVNIIDYYDDKYNPDVTWFRIYDSNGITQEYLLKVTKKVNENNTETFWYSYPYSEESGEIYKPLTSNYVKYGCYYSFIVSNENMEKLLPEDDMNIEQNPE